MVSSRGHARFLRGRKRAQEWAFQVEIDPLSRTSLFRLQATHRERSERARTKSARSPKGEHRLSRAMRIIPSARPFRPSHFCVSRQRDAANSESASGLRRNQIFLTNFHLPIIQRCIPSKHLLQIDFTLVCAGKGCCHAVEHPLAHTHHGVHAGSLQEGCEQPTGKGPPEPV